MKALRPSATSQRSAGAFNHIARIAGTGFYAAPSRRGIRSQRSAGRGPRWTPRRRRGNPDDRNRIPLYLRITQQRGAEKTGITTRGNDGRTIDRVGDEDKNTHTHTARFTGMDIDRFLEHTHPGASNQDSTKARPHDS